ncbi:hypothetical protein A6A06_38390 [Streptomyces sp. CB02923]|nr:hypothetical protein A6A06_38390 [Streptomyces sp. CB02923]
MSAYRITFSAQARADLLALGELLAQEVLVGITAELGTDPHGGTSIERPLGGGPWDRVAFVAGWATVRYLVSEGPGIDPPVITVIRVIP